MKFVVQKNGSINFSANWTPNQYTITFDNQGATTAGTSSIKITYNTTILSKITIPTKNGYTFGGYYTAQNGRGTQRIKDDGNWTNTSNTTFLSNTTLYAKRTPNTYYVTYDLNGGSPFIQPQSFIFNSQDPISSVTPTKANNVFLYRDYNGKHLNPGEKIPTGRGNFTLTAIRSTCTSCSATNAYCTLSIKDNKCTYSTSCKDGYTNIQNSGTYHPSCTPASCPSQGGCPKTRAGGQCTTYSQSESCSCNSYIKVIQCQNDGTWSDTPYNFAQCKSPSSYTTFTINYVNLTDTMKKGLMGQCSSQTVTCTEDGNIYKVQQNLWTCDTKIWRDVIINGGAYGLNCNISLDDNIPHQNTTITCTYSL